jgi:hypothetical protein
MGRGALAIWGLLAALSGATSFAAAAQEEPPPAVSGEPRALPLGQRFGILIMQGRYLDALETFETATAAEQEQAWPSYEQYRPALDGFFVPAPDQAPLAAADPADLAAYDGAVAQDAIAAIVERARATRIVIVNEAHDSPRDRAFILKVAVALRPLGFTHYAAETFTNQTPELAAAAMGRLAAEGYPVRSTGTYTSDPMFGFLVRRAMALGYRPVAYEIPFTPELAALSGDDGIALREQTQAENLARALAAAGPEAKFLIHVGYGHAAERLARPDGVPWMAARLAELTGIDPLTIDQTQVSENDADPANRALHVALAPHVGDRPAVFFRDGQALASRPLGEAVDLQVVHLLEHAVDGRPDWLRTTGRRAVAIPDELVPAIGRRLVQVFVAGEADDAIPLDQALVSAGQDAPVLYVPEGVELRWAVQD